MTNLDTRPDEVRCDAEPRDEPELITPRDVPLGGIRAMTVRRTLPARGRPLIGAWCFADHYGPDDVSVTGGMDVAPHPHCGLQTVSWLFEGEIEHRDSLGTREFVRPGELNLMTAGRGIAHSEVSTSATTTLHGMQLWVALPDDQRAIEARFDHYVPDAVRDGGAQWRVFLGELAGELSGEPAGVRSPVATHTPLLGAELTLAAGAATDVALEPEFEHAVLVDTGAVSVDGQQVASAVLAALPAGRRHTRIEAGDTGARLLLLGGTPLESDLAMWWNFVGRSHEEIVAAREQWQAEIGAGEIGIGAGEIDYDDVPADAPVPRFGAVRGYGGDPLPAPRLPGGRLRPRRRHTGE